MPPLILSLQFDPAAFARLNALRQQHFPRERNFIPPPATLFHALPGEQLLLVQSTLAELCATTPPIPLTLPSVRFLGKGTALDIEAPPLLPVRQTLAQAWQAFLTPQDRQKWRPHVTIQNKVSPEAGRALFTELLATWQPMAATGEGLLLWEYLGGPWRLVATYPFTGPPAA